jgi:hypothetical protein
VREFPEELGKHLAEFALRRIQDPRRVPQQIVIPTRVIIRQSTRPLLAEGQANAHARSSAILNADTAHSIR